MARKYLPRACETLLRQAVDQFPVAGLTGPRQAGKSTTLRKLFPDYQYITLDDPTLRSRAATDPGLFIESIGTPCVIDEIQYAPELLPHIKMEVDQDRSQTGQYLLTGSQVFPLMSGITESLAGRISLFELLGFSLDELGFQQQGCSTPRLFETLFRGFYPEPAVHGVAPKLFYGSYLQTYLERDIRQISSVHDLRLFQQFLELLAARVGSLLNMNQLSRDCGISHTTARKWLSLLESTRIVYLLRPYFKNISKRVMKSPKVYFTDTGLLAHLLRYPTPETVQSGPMNGAFFENLLIIEFLKRKLNQGHLWELYFYRDSNGKEIDLILEGAHELHLVEIKLKKTLQPADARSLASFPDTVDQHHKYLISCHPDMMPLARDIQALPWWEAARVAGR